MEMRPRNYQFVLGNLLEGLPFPDNSFDYVHMRALVTAIPHNRWQGVIDDLARVTRPAVVEGSSSHRLRIESAVRTLRHAMNIYHENL
jgi:ubiquinone/menaquinone biosynthesis C-methylase UbiE